ncbi:MAG: iron chelate uptake ABC transporter family permease subunit [Flavonifractor plautii]
MKQFCRLVKAHTFLTCLVLAAVLLASIIIGIGTGPVAIPFAEVWRVMFHRLGGLLTGSELPWRVRESTQNIVWFLRAPRVPLGALVGAALTLSGVGMQAFTKNPLAEPYVLGISSGASLGAVLAMSAGGVPACAGPPVGVRSAPLPGLWCPSSWCTFWPAPEMR